MDIIQGEPSSKKDYQSDPKIHLDEDDEEKEKEDVKENSSSSIGGQWGRWAIIFGYIGESYQGLQKNPGAKTIEDAVETALFHAGIIEASDYGTLSKVGWNRAARTDKGVHAAGQVISLMLRLREGETEDDLRVRTNSFLPSEIRVFDFVRVTKQFNAKNLCSGRKYGYILPTFTLRPVDSFASIMYVQKHKGLSKEVVTENGSDDYTSGDAFGRGRQHMLTKRAAFRSALPSSEDLLRMEAAIAQSEKLTSAATNVTPRFEIPDAYQTGAAFVLSLSTTKVLREKDFQSRVNGAGFRLRASEWETLRNVLQKFCGTRSFHNFTPRLEAGDATTVRYITECVPSKPFIVGEGAEAMEFVHVTIQGQSFLLNQIRHMIGLTIDRVRGQCGESVMDLAFSGGSFKLPLAPAEGLYLGQCYFLAYDRRYGKDHQSMTVLRPHAAERMKDFMENVIWRHIGKSVLGEKKPFHEYMEEMRTNPLNYKFRPPPPMQMKALERFQAQQARKQARHEYYHVNNSGSNPLEKPAFEFDHRITKDSTAAESALNSIVFQPAVINHNGPVSKQAKEKSDWKKKIRQEKIEARLAGTKRQRVEGDEESGNEKKEINISDVKEVTKMDLDLEKDKDTVVSSFQQSSISGASGNAEGVSGGESAVRGRGGGGGGGVGVGSLRGGRGGGRGDFKGARGGRGRGGGGGGGDKRDADTSSTLQTWRPGQTVQPQTWKPK
jgi:tRNA pseudouridine38-40 synthase